MAWNRKHLLLLAFPLLVLASDFYHIVVRSYSHQGHHHDRDPHHQHEDALLAPPKYLGSTGVSDPLSLGGKFHISFCSSCSYKKTVVQTRNVLLSFFPEREVLLTNHPPPLSKRLLRKLVPVVQFGAIALVVGGDHIFPRLGYVSPPSWYNSLRQNRFGAAAGAWIIGNALQNMLQSTGAFEVYFDGDLIFSKLKENRFPDEFELRERVGKTMELKAIG